MQLCASGAAVVFRYVIKRHRPGRDLALVGLLALLVGLAVFIYLERELSVVRVERNRLAHEGSEPTGDVEDLRVRYAGLEKQMAVDKHAHRIERNAYDQVKIHLTSLQDKVLSLEEEVAFYRGIVASNSGRGLHIKTFSVDPDLDDGVYRYQLVLTRNMKSDTVTSGTVSLSVTGKHQGNFRNLSLADLSADKDRVLSFQFKYFQRLEGRLRLPPGFVPHRVRILVSAPNERPSTIERVFDWPSAIGKVGEAALGASEVAT